MRYARWPGSNICGHDSKNLVHEAGGHRGIFDPQTHDDCLGTLALTRLLVRELDVPVLAAGGIMDGAGISAALRRAVGWPGRTARTRAAGRARETR